MDVPYTSDADFELTVKDPTTELIGYIDQIIAPVTVQSKNGKKYELFKFVLSNGSDRRVLCLIWGAKLIKQYQSEITIHWILHIDGSMTKAALMNSEKYSLNVIPFKIIITEGSVLEYLGIHELELPPPAEQPTNVDFETIVHAEGLICIKGYIKTKFARSSGQYETMSDGCGAITDGRFKLTVQISNFGNVDVEKGVYVTVIGTVVNRDGMIKVFCKADNNITVDPDHERMAVETLRRGTKQVIALKRKATDEA